MYNDIIKILKSKANIPKLPTQCPIPAGFYWGNYTHDSVNNPLNAIGKYISDRILPNGEYRHVSRAYNKKYGELGSGVLQLTHHVRLNDENFWTSSKDFINWTTNGKNKVI